MGNELARIDTTLAIGSEWAAMKEQAGYLVKSGFMPVAIKTAEQAIAVMLQGREVGMGPMAAIRHINIIQGKPSMSAEGMLGVCYKNIAGFKAEPIEDTEEAFTIRLTRPGMQPYESRFTMADAERAGLLAKGGNWKQYPKAMLRARAISAGCRLLCPDALMGISYTPEELGAEVDEDGNVINGEIIEESRPATTTVGQAARAKANVPQAKVKAEVELSSPDGLCTYDQKKHIHALAGDVWGKTKDSVDQYKAWLFSQTTEMRDGIETGTATSTELTVEEASEIIERLIVLQKERQEAA